MDVTVGHSATDPQVVVLEAGEARWDVALRPTDGGAFIAAGEASDCPEADVLLAALLRETASAESASIDVAAALAPRFEAAGFHRAATVRTWTRAGHITPPPPLTAHALYPISSCEVMELWEYDRHRIGVHRGPQLARLMSEHPHRAFVAFDRVTGVIAAVGMGDADGMGILVADAPLLARWLLFACERSGTPARMRTATEVGERLMQEAGWQEADEPCIRMVRGDLPGRQDTWFGGSLGIG